ncbi:hypothetical protein QBC34DRAFT_383719 [Podospora aff. communis PSN243]|uniref:Uncharacterized protein n=1 Tax=Podospora aff. communis PSN243 TaxID=3040156 RepID=A0AAV9GB25_9PEZI|nr:hypothetical protein QBC34DRAFT_383719 [Podospora aff. communis PSN243]
MQLFFSIVTIDAAMGLAQAAAVLPGGTAKPTHILAARQTASTTLTALTVRITNKAGVDLWTRHDGTLGQGSGTMAVDASDTNIITAGHGAIFVNRHDHKVKTDNESQVEFNFGPEDGKEKEGSKPVLDVSYVAGFTYPIDCLCSGPGTGSGCSIDLWAQGNECPLPDDHLGCDNPKQGAGDGDKDPHPFFRPYLGKAYVVPGDHSGLSNNLCPSATFDCTVYGNNKGDAPKSG